MLRFDFTNSTPEAVGKNHGASLVDLEKLSSQIQKAHEKLVSEQKSGKIGFWNLSKNKNLVTEILQKASEVKSRFDNFVVIGIGGSSLGLKCLLQALLPPTYNLKDTTGRKGHPKIFVLENPDPTSVSDLLDTLDLNETAFNVISKSGKTIETLSVWGVVEKILKEKTGKRWHEHVFMTTDPTEGALRKLVTEEKLASFPVPQNVGGRFSVLSAVGLFPAACCGIDIAAVLKGAQTAVERGKASALAHNSIYHNGALNYFLATQKQKSISVMMPYGDRFERFSDWYAQLWGESLGKTDKAQTPLAGLGAQDQHSLLQLYRGGPKNKVVTFIRLEDYSKDSLGKILNMELAATAQSLAEANCPSVTLTLPTLNAETLGELLMTYQIQTVFTGHLFGVNPYDQPGVERGKELIAILQQT